MDLSYVLMPGLAWVVAGSTKFVVNSVKSKRLAFDLIGYGGMPSTHSAIVSALAALIAFREGVDHPAFGVAFTLALVVMMDANSLRRQIGRQAQVINRLNASAGAAPLRERMGHTHAEIAAGILVGIAVAWVTDQVSAHYL